MLGTQTPLPSPWVSLQVLLLPLGTSDGPTWSCLKLPEKQKGFRIVCTNSCANTNHLWLRTTKCPITTVVLPWSFINLVLNKPTIILDEVVGFSWKIISSPDVLMHFPLLTVMVLGPCPFSGRSDIVLKESMSILKGKKHHKSSLWECFSSCSSPGAPQVCA